MTTSFWEEEEHWVATLLFATGLALTGIASFGRLWCSLYIAGYKDKQLITEGPYSSSRNPLYFFSMLGVLGVGLCSETLTIPAICLVAFLFYYPSTIRREEEKMRKIHGAAYDDYVARTPRFWPKFSKLKEPETYMVKTSTFRSHIIQALGFFMTVGILEIIEELHKLHWLPRLAQIY